ncbi:MAG: hypothetical protein WC383_08230 [Gammaproteobacteria bacterium]
MPERQPPIYVGAPDPELKNSLIIEETDEDFHVLAQEAADVPVCYFNGIAYPHGQHICSGTDLLRCEDGAWVREGSCDPVNP